MLIAHNSHGFEILMKLASPMLACETVRISLLCDAWCCTGQRTQLAFFQSAG